MKRIYIAEKPELARAIVDALGENFSKKDGYYSNGKDTVTYCFGHLLKLFDPEDYDKKYKNWSFDHLPIVMVPWKLKPVSGKEKQLKIIIELMKKADEIIHAGDPDGEGQLIVDEIIKYAKVKKPVKRLLINDNNIDVVKKSLQSMRKNEEFKGEYNSALARSVADQLYGYNLTRAYTLSAQSKGIHTILSVGRVQTPILGMVVNRDRAHENHKKTGYYNLVGKFKFGKGWIKANFNPKESDPTDEKKRIIDKAFAEKIKQDCKSQKAVVTSVTSEKTSPAPLPFNLLQLQTEAHKKHGIRPDETLKITQDLREKRKLITYNRSDCQFLSDEQHAEAPAILSTIEKNCTEFKKAVQKADTKIKSRAFNSKNVTAHHAIIPTKMPCNLNQLGKDELKIYLMIVRVYLAQFYSKKVYDLKELEITCTDHSFSTSQTTIKRRGWTELYQDQDSKTEPKLPDDLQQFSSGNSGECEDVDIEVKETTPPKLYTLGTLMKDLSRVSQYVSNPEIKKILLEKDKDKKGEAGGIGTPATRTAIINTLLKRKFIEEKNKNVVSTALGRSFHDSLPQSAISPDMTALWHEKQNEIRSGKLGVDEFLNEITRYLAEEVEIARKLVLSIKSQNPKCPACTGYLIKRKGKKGVFWACSQYPECKKTYPDKEGKPDTSVRKCAECGEALIRRPGKKSGYWWACSGFPKCRITYFDVKGEPSIS